MAAVGMVQMSCFCGLDIFYIGNSAEGDLPLEAIELFRKRLGDRGYAIFTSEDGAQGICPKCQTVYDLPDPETMEWLPFLDDEKFAEALEQIKQESPD